MERVDRENADIFLGGVFFGCREVNLFIGGASGEERKEEKEERKEEVITGRLHGGKTEFVYREVRNTKRGGGVKGKIGGLVGYLAPHPKRTTGMVLRRMTRSRPRDQLSMYSRSMAIHSSKSVTLLRPRICQMQVRPGFMLRRRR